MDLQQERDIVKLLNAMNDELIERCIETDVPCFCLESRDNSIVQKLGFDYDYFYKLLKICYNLKYIDKKVIAYGFDGIALTEKGQQKAMIGTLQPSSSTGINIGQIVNNNSNIQIGNNNTQNINIIFQRLEEAIEASDAPENEKRSALKLLKDFINSPLIVGLLPPIFDKWFGTFIK